MNQLSDGAATTGPWTEAEARARVGARALERGRLYDAGGALFDLRIEGGHFTARCEGSGAEVYRLRARRAGATTIEAHCSCPVGESGSCKHAAALLLFAAREPEAFVTIEPLAALCERAGGGPLAAAIVDYVARVAEVEAGLRVAITEALGERAPSASREDPKDAVGEAFRQHAGDAMAATDVARSLAVVFARGRALAAEGDALGAARVFRAVSAGIMARSRRFEDHEGALRELAQSALEAIGRLLAHCPQHSNARQLARDALFDAYRYDAENGTVYGRAAGVILGARASAEDRAQLAETARKSMEGIEAWARRVFEGALVDLEGETLSDEAFLERCREAKRPRELLLRLLQRGRVDEAAGECAKMGEAPLIEALELCDECDCAVSAEALVERLSRDGVTRSRALSWWRDRLVGRGDARAWDASAMLFLARPDRLVWRTLRDEAGPQWSERSGALLDALARRGGAAWVEALIDEGRIDEAIRSAESMSATNAHPVRIELAERVASRAPLEAAELLRAQAEALIGMRGRPNYREAGRVLRRARELYESVGQRGLWVAYSESLRARARELPALREELAAALARPAPIDLTANEAANDNAERARPAADAAQG
jgi:uncharacterized Zn finger protein